MTTPSEFLRGTFPTLFAKGVQLLEQEAAGGDERSQRIVDDIKGVTGAACLVLGQEAPLYVTARQGSLSVGDSPGDSVEVKLAAAVPGDALNLLLGEASKEGALDDDEVAIAAAQTTSKRLEDALAGREMTCHLTVKEVPDLGDVTVRLGFNVETPPDDPGFTCEIDYADLEAVQQKTTTAQELFMEGKLRMQGDYSIALQLSMQLLTNPL